MSPGRAYRYKMHRYRTSTGKVVFLAPRGAWTQHGDVCGCAAARSGAPISSRPHEHKWHSSSSSRGEPRALQPSAARLSHGSPPFAVLAPTPALSAKNEKIWLRSDAMRADFKTTSNRERSGLAPAGRCWSPRCDLSACPAKLDARLPNSMRPSSHGPTPTSL